MNSLKKTYNLRVARDMLERPMASIENDCLRELRPNYLRRLEQRVQFLEGLAQLTNETGLTAEACSEIHRAAHSMGSSAAIYGYAELSNAARNAELVFSDSGAHSVDKVLPLRDLITSAKGVLFGTMQSQTTLRAVSASTDFPE